MQKRKLLVKFKVVDKEINHKLTPVSKAETQHQLDLNCLKKAKNLPGYLALSGKDGFIYFHSMDLDNKAKKPNGLHFFHHDSGGVVQSNFSADGCILAVNDKGCVQLFQSRQTRSPSNSNSRRGKFSGLRSVISQVQCQYWFK